MDGPGSGSSSSASESDDDQEASAEEPEKCEGRLLTIDRAEEYLDDPDWRRLAPFAEETQATLREWRSNGEWDRDAAERMAPGPSG
jgi:hypothetical protein